MNRTYRNKVRPAYIDAVHAEVLREVKEHGWMVHPKRHEVEAVLEAERKLNEVCRLSE